MAAMLAHLRERKKKTKPLRSQKVVSLNLSKSKKAKKAKGHSSYLEKGR